MKSSSDIRAEWRSLLHSTETADRPRAEAAARDLYTATGLGSPKYFVWFDSPFAASWAVAAIAAKYHFLWTQALSPSSLSRDDAERLNQAKKALGDQLGIGDWNVVLAAVGKPLGMHLQFPPVPGPSVQMQLVEARYALTGEVSSMFEVHGDDDDLQRAEDRFSGGNRGALRSALHCPKTDAIIGHSFYEEYSFSTMADDQLRVGDREPPPIMRAAWDVARSAGLWWPFEHLAILSERPAEVHLNDQLLIERGDGPAVVYRDGWSVYAWNGMALPERFIQSPESIPPRELKHLDARFRKYVESRVGKPAGKPTKRAKLPLFDRYQAGDHAKVWSELIALGSAVRDEPNAADAMAVAYETMRRVDANVRTIVQRLGEMGYTFSTKASRTDQWIERSEGVSRIDLDQLMPGAGGSPHLGSLFNMVSRMRDVLGGQVSKAKAQPRDTTIRAHVPPDANTRKSIASFEKEVGVLPLSLRAFYEVVGSVDLMGEHPTLSPREGSVAPDPLVVYSLEEAYAGGDEDEDDEHPSALAIAPDDLHKADTSGGDPYEIAIGDLRADGEVLNERHGLFFVDYLRLCFQYGGFPGYEGQAEVPREIETLRAGLLEF